jgi:hypothetical protein
MEMTRTVWSDERLDDFDDRVHELARRTDIGFTRVDDEFRALRGEMNSRFDAQETRFDEIQRGMMAMTGTMVLGFGSLIATQL